jgi:beta-galactosidase
MTPFSSEDVTLYSNCDKVTLKALKDGETKTYVRDSLRKGMPYPPIIFKDAYNFMQIKERTRKDKREDVYLVAEGYIEGKKVATDTVVPSYRPEKIKLWIDNEGTNLVADGSDFVTVIAAITDKYGTIKRLNNYTLKFEVEGEGELIGDDPYLSNPKAIQWGTAPILVRATTIAGEIKVKASLDFDGINRAIETELIFESIPSDKKLVFSSEELTDYKKRNTIETEKTNSQNQDLLKKIKTLEKEINDLKLKKTENQQEQFGEKNNNE